MVEKNKCKKCEMAKPKKLPKGQASGTAQPKKAFGAVPKREQAATPSLKRGKICPKTGYAGCKCKRSQGIGGGCKN